MTTSGSDTKRTKENGEEYRMAFDWIRGSYPVGPIHRETKFRTIDSHSWDSSFYRGEGNATLVVSLPNEKKVIRFRKFEPAAGGESPNDAGEIRVRLIVDFYRNVISGLMGIYAMEPQIVLCNSDDLRSRMCMYESRRPVNRRHKIVVETYATILPDYTLLPECLNEKISSNDNGSTFCIEIKPKDGSLDESLPPYTICEFCQKQRSKMEEEGILSTTAYCPGDLFSGDKDRMHRAIEALIQSPQNYFKIFREGELVWGKGFDRNDLDMLLEEWFHRENTLDENIKILLELMCKALLRPSHQLYSENHRLSTSARTKIHGLSMDSVLGRIATIQKLYKCDVDAIYHLYAKYSNTLDDEAIYSGNNNPENPNITITEIESIPNREEIRALRDYLVYRIVRDCSILIAFRQINSATVPRIPPEKVIQLPGKRYYIFNAAVTDLDPKSVHCIEKHHRRKKIKIGSNEKF